MNVHEFHRLPEDLQAEVLKWLEAHGLKVRYVFYWEIDGDHLIANVYRTNADGYRYMVNCVGKSRTEDPDHGRAHGSRRASCWHVAAEQVRVPLLSEPPARELCASS